MLGYTDYQTFLLINTEPFQTNLRQFRSPNFGLFEDARNAIFSTRKLNLGCKRAQVVLSIFIYSLALSLHGCQ